ncbi:condensin-2 complex subunit D3-like isoform X2 [Lutzomyia longipalpis]|uniref:condensin-2 complex subunit D3-like isoform X2 n=1 Tax=Lutzomyia longipalpis TaxID=7200 RepID=UPI0024842A5E|nr:condensin-2 complex subunit D3-like isoform X2 [Lutzomyia longipalpis]
MVQSTIGRHFSDQLSTFFDDHLDAEQLTEVLAAEDASSQLQGIQLLQKVKYDASCSSILLEITSEMRNIRNYVHFNQSDGEKSDRELSTVSWDKVLREIKKDSYLTFIQCLVGVLGVDFHDKISRKLGCLAGDCFVLTLVIPGAKRCGVFEESLLQTIAEYPKYLEDGNLSKQEVNEFKIFLLTLLEDLQFLFKHVSLEEFEDLRTAICVSMKNIILFFYQNGYKAAIDCSLTRKAYEMLKDLCAALHGDTTKNLTKIFSLTTVLHNHSASGIRNTQDMPHSDSIAGFFIYLLDQFPTNTTQILTTFIEATLSNPEENIRAEQYSATLEIAVKYEKAIFEKCNVSIIPYLERLVCSEDATQRANGTDFLSRIALIDCQVNWSIFQEEVSKIPREVKILQLLFTKTIDVNNNVKMKALSGLTKIFSGGNRNTQKILRALFKNPPERDEEIPGIEEVTEVAEEFPNYLFHLLQSSLAHVRKNSLTLLENLLAWNEKLLESGGFFEELARLVDDSSSLVRRQIISTLNTLMKTFPQKEVVIKGWTRCILRLMRDNDGKIVDAAMESLKMVIFDNIERHEDSSTTAAQMPWITLRTMMQQEQRKVLRSAMDSWIRNSIVTQKTLGIIESHTNTENATEAWLLLSLVASKMHTKDPDRVVLAFVDTLNSSSANLVNQHFMLEIIHAWMPHFSRTTLNNLYNLIQRHLSEGNLPTSLVSPLYNVCLKQRQSAEMEHDREWIITLNAIAEDFVWTHRLQLTSSEWEINQKMVNFLYIYSETSMDLTQKPRQRFLDFFYQLLRECRVTQASNPEKCCTLVIFVSRLAIRDTDIAAEVLPELGKLLKTTQHKSVACNIIVALTNLCKKHTTLTEPIMQEVVSKLKASVTVIRYKALSALTTLVMQDYIKMRGRLLMNVLAAIVDPCRSIARAAAGMVLKYVEEKNRLLLQTSFLEVIYVYNGYMYERFEVFNTAEMDDEVCPLQGKSKRHLRFLLYRFFLQNFTDLQLLMFLNNVATVQEKIHKETLIKTPESVEALEDLVEVFTRVCEFKSWTMLKSAGNSRDPDDLPDEEVDLPIVQEKSEEAGNPEDIGNLKQAIPVLDKMVAILPNFVTRMEAFDGRLKDKVDIFCEAVCDNFKSFVEYAQPEKFWKKYRDVKRQKKPQAAVEKVLNFEDEDEEDFDM